MTSLSGSPVRGGTQRGDSLDGEPRACTTSAAALPATGHAFLRATERAAAAAELRGALSVALRDPNARPAAARRLAERRADWRLGFAQLQHLAQAGDTDGARSLAGLLLDADGAAAAELEAALGAPLPPPDAAETAEAALEALREAASGLPERIPADLDGRIAAALAACARAADRPVGPPLGEDALRLAALPGLAHRLAPLWPPLLGLDGRAAPAAAAFAEGADAPELLLHLEALLDPALGGDPSGADLLMEALGPAQGIRLVHALRKAGRAEGSRLALRTLVGLGLAEPPEVIRLILMEAEDGLGALEILDVATALTPDSALLRVEHAKALAASGRADEALAEARAAMDLPHRAVDTALGAADILASRGHSAEAAPALLRLVEQHPSSAPLLQRAAAAQAAAGDIADAERLARLAVAAASGQASPHLRLLLARLAAGRGARAEALALLGPLLGDPAVPEAEVLFLDLVVAVTWRALPDDVDFDLVAAAEARIAARPAGLPLGLLCEAMRLFLLLEREGTVRLLGEAAAERLRLRADPLPPRSMLVLLPEMRAEPGGLSPEQLGRELVLQGRALLSGGQRLLAGLCFRMAAAAAPDDPAARFNAAFAAIADGRPEEASRLLAGLERIYDTDMTRVAWPLVGGERWPDAGFPHHAAFEALKPPGAEWPLITVITPSYNQAAYVEETLLSVLHQNYPRLQYVVVDGNSNDGSVAILERYRDRLDTLIVEPDRGQTHAINKGLRLAKGEIITWLNSDDMLAPGALHAVALAWLGNRADLVFGYCLPHRSHVFQLANLPKARQDTFTRAHLSQIFALWMKGFFFYQPEVFFTRRILDAAGGELREDLVYTMDYDFWLRCAAAGATVEPLHWPIALFRQHAEQKTSRLVDCVVEQGAVRDRHVRIAPPAARRADICVRTAGAFTRPRPRLGVISSRMHKIFSADAAGDLAAALAASGIDATLVERADDLPEGTDMVIKLLHLQEDEADIAALRRGGFGGPLLGWFWDNHHHLAANFAVGEALDLSCPGHAFARHYLRNASAIQIEPLALCTTQWSAREADAFWRDFAEAPRTDALYGGFVRYPFARPRNRLVEQLRAAGLAGVYLLEEHDLTRYFGLTPRERFREWASHKVSLALPLAGDVSQRIFDALLTGQVPIVPRDVHDFDAVIPPDLQRELPVIRFDAYQVEAVRAAAAEAVAAFDRGGPVAAAARHRFALDGHMFPVRVRELVARLRMIPEDPLFVEVAEDGAAAEQY